MSLTDEIREALKLNDPDYMDTISEIKQRYVSQGISIETIREKIRELIHEDSKPAAMPEPEAPQPVTPEPQTSVQDRRTESELSRHHGQSYEPTTTRKDSDSMILRMADEKKGR